MFVGIRELFEYIGVDYCYVKIAVYLDKIPLVLIQNMLLSKWENHIKDLFFSINTYNGYFLIILTTLYDLENVSCA